MMQAARKTITETTPSPSLALDRRRALLDAQSNLDDALAALKTLAVMIPAALVDLGDHARSDRNVRDGIDILLNDICRRIEKETVALQVQCNVEALNRISQPARG